MTSRELSRFALGVCAAAAMLAGCGGSQPPIGAPGATLQALATGANHSESRTVAEANRNDLLYVANFDAGNGTGDITVYRADGKNPAPIQTISDGLNAPQGDCLDSHGNLYVTNEPSNGAGWVAEYAFGKGRPSKTITDGITTPGYCAIDNKGNLWVTNIGGPNATEYLYGSKTPHTVITKDMTFPVGVAIDSSDNLYVANRLRSGGNVVVYAPGGKTPSRTITDGVTSPVAIAIDASGILYVTNIVEANVEEYLPDEGQPFKTITQGIPTPEGVAVNKTGRLYVANGAGVNNLVVEFAPEIN